MIVKVVLILVVVGLGLLWAIDATSPEEETGSATDASSLTVSERSQEAGPSGSATPGPESDSHQRESDAASRKGALESPAQEPIITEYELFARHLDDALQGVPDSQFEVGQIMMDCQYAAGYASLDALRSDWQNSDFYHSDGPEAAGYQSQIDRFDACRQVVAALPSGESVGIWGIEMVIAAAEADHRAAQLRMAPGTDARLRLLDAYPQVLNQHADARKAALDLLAERDPAYLEDPVNAAVWEFARCNLDPTCNSATVWEQAEAVFLPVELDRVQEGYAAVEDAAANGELPAELRALVRQLPPETGER